MFYNDIPRDIKVMYVRAVCQMLTYKAETNKTRLATGGGIVGYTTEVSTPTTDLTTLKIHVNILISEIISHYMCMYAKDFYLKNYMDLT